MLANIDVNQGVSQLDYTSIFKFLAGRFGSCYSNNEYYRHVDYWTQLYKGWVGSVHTILAQNGLSSDKRASRTLNMAKRVAEDWASTIMADKPVITINGRNQATSRFVQGAKGNGGVLGTNNFFSQFCDSIERAFALGTSAVVLGISEVIDNPDMRYKIDLNFYNAISIIPIKYKNNIITDCAFLSSFMSNGKRKYNLSCHVKNEVGKYVIYNYEAGEDLKFDSYLADNVEGFETNSSEPLFFIIKPQKANNVDLDSPLGVSVYNDATDIVIGCDFIYDQINQDILTGQRIILMDKSLLGIDPSGKPIPPQDFKKWCMQFVGDEGAVDIDKVIKEFSPDLHGEDLCDTLQQNLNLLSMRCGLGTNYYNFDKTAGVTATEYVGSQQDLVRNVNINLTNISDIMTNIVKKIIWVGVNILGYDLLQDAKVIVTIPDGVVTNDAAEKEQDRQDVRDGIMSKAEYRAKWYGETLEDAQQKIDEMNGVQKEDNKDNDKTEDVTNPKQNTNASEQETT